MTKCCENCKRLLKYRKETLEKLEDVMKACALRPGSADCDVNPLALNEPARRAMARLEDAHDAVSKMFDAIGAK